MRLQLMRNQRLTCRRCYTHLPEKQTFPKGKRFDRISLTGVGAMHRPGVPSGLWLLGVSGWAVGLFGARWVHFWGLWGERKFVNFGAEQKLSKNLILNRSHDGQKFLKNFLGRFSCAGPWAWGGVSLASWAGVAALVPFGWGARGPRKAGTWPRSAPEAPPKLAEVGLWCVRGCLWPRGPVLWWGGLGGATLRPRA